MNFPVLRRKIRVQVNPWWTISQFFTRHWQFLLGALAPIVVGLLAYFGKRWWEGQDRKRSAEADQSNETNEASESPESVRLEAPLQSAPDSATHDVNERRENP